MTRQSIIENIKHCDHYIETSNDHKHIEYYKLRKEELLKKLPGGKLPKQGIKVKSIQSPKQIALKYFDRIDSTQVKQIDVAKKEKVNIGSLSKAISRIRKGRIYGESRSFKKDYL